MKYCTRCNSIKWEDEFNKNKRSKDGLSIYCSECHREACYKYRRENKAEFKRKSRAKTLKYIHGITEEEYNEMLQKQDNKCAICADHIDELGKPVFDVDHNHSTGKVRGLLCRCCNLGIGKLKDSALVCHNAFQYLMLNDCY